MVINSLSERHGFRWFMVLFLIPLTVLFIIIVISIRGGYILVVWTWFVMAVVVVVEGLTNELKRCTWLAALFACKKDTAISRKKKKRDVMTVVIVSEWVRRGVVESVSDVNVSDKKSPSWVSRSRWPEKGEREGGRHVWLRLSKTGVSMVEREREAQECKSRSHERWDLWMGDKDGGSFLFSCWLYLSSDLLMAQQRQQERTRASNCTPITRPDTMINHFHCSSRYLLNLDQHPSDWMPGRAVSEADDVNWMSALNLSQSGRERELMQHEAGTRNRFVGNMEARTFPPPPTP